MRVIRLTLQYDGTGYVGWQRQARGTSVQGLLEDVLETIEQRPVAVIGAGRTDAGAHALGQVASFHLEHPIDVMSLRRALNALLPDAVRVVSVEEAAASFHARYAARSKTYLYRILNAAVEIPFERFYAWQVTRPLDGDAMARAVTVLHGRHDFAAFQAAGSGVQTTTRTIFDVRLAQRLLSRVGDPQLVDPVSRDGALLTLEVTGDGFLRHMVRNIVGTLVEVGLGRREPEDLRRTLESRNRHTAGPTAPAHGLFLVRVDYEDWAPR